MTFYIQINSKAHNDWPQKPGKERGIEAGDSIPGSVEIVSHDPDEIEISAQRCHVVTGVYLSLRSTDLWQIEWRMTLVCNWHFKTLVIAFTQIPLLPRLRVRVCPCRFLEPPHRSLSETLPPPSRRKLVRRTENYH